MRNAWFVLGLLIMSVSCTAQVLEKLDPQAFQNQIQSDSGEFKILDLRTDEEVVEGKVPGAEQLDFYSDDFESQLKKLNKQATYYIYCRSGGRSGKTLDKMKELGFEQVYDMQGGMNAWKAAGLPAE